MKTGSNQISGNLSVVNGQASAVVLVLEPWGDQSLVAPGAVAEVDVSGPAPMRIEVEVTDAGITIYGWEGAVMSVRP